MAIIYDVGFRIDPKDIEPQLAKIRSEIDKAFKSSKGVISSQLSEGVHQANLLEAALKRATTERGTSFIGMNLALKQANTSAAQMAASLSGAGLHKSLDVFTQQFAAADRSLLSINSRVQEAQRVMMQSFKYSLAQSVQRFALGEIQSSIGWVKNLNAELNQISIVSGHTGAALDKVYASIIRNSEALRVTALDYAEASTIFYQQGLDMEEVERRTEIAVKSAKVAGQSIEDMAEQLTAIWNTYGMTADQMERAASIAAKIGAETAVDFADIATGMQLAASSAALMGVSYESLNAIIATVGETTRQSASTVGNAYKTIFSRFEDLKSSGEEGQVELGRLSTQLSNMGLNVLDAAGNLRELDEVIWQSGTSWETYSTKQQIAIAQIVGGTRQYAQFIALMENFDKYQKNLLSAQSEIGGETLAEQYAIALTSIDTAMENSSQAWRKAFADIFTDDLIKGFYVMLEDAGRSVGELISGLGGVQGVLAIVGTYLSRQIIPAAAHLKDLFVEMWDARSVDAQLDRIQRDFNAMSKAVQSVHFTGSNGIAANMDEITSNALTQEKLRMETEIAKANVYINDLKRRGAETDKIAADAAKGTLADLHEEYNRNISIMGAVRKRNKEEERVLGYSKTRLNNQKAELAAQHTALAAAGKLETVEGDRLDRLKQENRASLANLDVYQSILDLQKDTINFVGKDQAEQSQEVGNHIKMIAANLKEIDTDRAKTLRKELEELANVSDGAAFQFSTISELLQNYVADSAEAGETMFSTEENVDRMAETFSRLSQAFDGTEVSGKAVNNILQELQEGARKNGVSAKYLGESFLNLSMGAVFLTQRITNLTTILASNEKTATQVAAALLSSLPAFAQAAQGYMALAAQMSHYIVLSDGVIAKSLAKAAAYLAEKEALKALLKMMGLAVAAEGAALLAFAAIGLAIVGIIAAFKHYEATQERARKQMIASAVAAKELAQANSDLANELRAVSEELDETRRKYSEGEITVSEYQDAIAALIEKVKELKSLNPSLEIIFTGDVDKFAEDVEKATQAAAEAAKRQAEAAMAAFETTIGKRVSGGLARDLDKGFSISETSKLTSIMTSFGAEHLGGNQFYIEDIARNFTNVINALGDAGEKQLQGKFKAYFEDMEGFAEYLASIDLADEAGSRIEYEAEREAFLNMKRGDSIEYLNTRAKAADDYTAALKEQADLSLQIAELEEYMWQQLLAEGDGYDSSEDDRQLAVLQLRKEQTEAIIAANKEAALSYSNFTTKALTGGSELDKATALRIRALSLLKTRLDENAFSATEWSKMQRHAITLAIRGEEDYIGILNKELVIARRKTDQAVMLQEMIAEFDSSASIQEQMKWLEKFNDQIELMGDSSGFKKLAENFLSIGENAQQLVLDRVNLAAAEQRAQGAAEAAIETENSAADAKKKNIDLYTRVLGVQREQKKNLDDIAEAEEALRQAQAEEQKILLNPYDDRGQAARAKTQTAEEHLNQLILKRTELETALTESQDAQTKNLAEIEGLEESIETTKKEQLAAEKELETVRNNAVTAAKEIITGLSSTDFQGTLLDQQNMLNAYNAALEMLGVSSQLTDNFLLLTERQQDNVLSLMLLTQAQEDYDRVLANSDATVLEAKVAFQQLAAATAQAFDLDLTELKDYTTHIQKVAKSVDFMSDSLATNQKMALLVAASISRVNKGLDLAAENVTDWIAALNDANRGSMSFAKALVAVDEAMSDLLGLNPGTLSDAFLSNAENLALLQQASEGSAEAFFQLQKAAFDEIVLKIDHEPAQQALNDLYALFEANEQLRLELGEEIEIGDIKDTTLKGLLDSFNEMLAAAEMTTDEVNAALDNLGVGVVYEEQTENQTMTAPPTITERVVARRVDGIDQYADGEGRPFAQNVYRTAFERTTEITPGAEIDAPMTFGAIGTEANKPQIKSIYGKGAGVGVKNSGKVFKSAHSPTARGAAPSKGKSGGGGGSTKDNKKADYKDRRERYRDLTNQMDAMARSTSRLSTAEASAFGLSRIALIQQKTAALRDEATTYAELAKAAQSYLTTDDRKRNIEIGGKKLSGTMGDQARLQQMLNTLGIGVTATFGEYGNLTNAEAVLTKLQNFYDIDYRLMENALNGSNEAFEKITDKLGVTEGALETILEQMQLIKTTSDMWQDSLESGVAKITEWIKNEIAAVEYKVDLRLAINDRDIRLIQQFIDRLSSRAGVFRIDKIAEQANFLLKNAHELVAGAVRFEEILTNLSSDSPHASWFSATYTQEMWDQWKKSGELPNEVMEALLSNVDAMIDWKDQMYDINDKMWASYRETLEIYLADFDSHLASFDTHESMLTSWIEIWKNVGGEYKNATTMLGLMNTQLDNQVSKTKELQKNHEFMLKRQTEAEQLYKTALEGGMDDATVQRAKDDWQQLISDTKTLEADVAAGIAQITTLIRAEASYQAELIRKTYAEALGGIFTDLGAATDMYAQKKAIDSFFLNEEDLQFELNQMLREMVKDTEALTDPVLLSKYQAWMERVNELKESGVQMTETELEILKAEFDLEKAQAAWQEAQQMKATMRLARDASGNWSYVYSADDKKADTSEADIEEKIHNIRKMHRDAADAAAEMWLSLNKDLEEYIFNIDQQRYESDMEYKNEVDQRLNWYNTQLDQHAGQVINHNAAIDRSFEDTVLGTITGLDSMELANNKYKENHSALVDALEKNHIHYEQVTDVTLNSVGINYAELADKMARESDSVRQENAKTEQSLVELRNAADMELAQMTVRIQNWAETWRTEITAIIASIDNLIAAQQRLASDSAGSAYTDFTWNKDYSAVISGAQSSGIKYSKEWYELQFKERYNKMLAAYNEEASEFGDTAYMQAVKDKWLDAGFSPAMSQADYVAQEIAKLDPNIFKGYQSGGLAVGSQLAYLAENGKKELVLNAGDTANFLQAIAIMRDGIANYLNSVGIARLGAVRGIHQAAGSGEAQTPVIIQADFPNVTARQEIEAAFSNLVNQAAQYQLTPRP